MMKISVFIKNSMKYCAPSIVSALIGMVSIPFISKIYPTAEFGKINMFYTVGNMMLYIVLLGLDSAYIRYYFELPGQMTRGNIFNISVLIGIINSIVLLLVFVIFFPGVVDKFIFGESNLFALLLLLFYIIGLIFFRLLSIETRMQNNAIMYNLQQIILIFTNRISFIIVALYSIKYIYSIFCIAASTFLFAIIFLFIRKKQENEDRHIKLFRVRKEDLSIVMRFAIPFMPTTLMTWLNNSAGKMVLSSYSNFEMVGILSIATSLANVFSLIPNAFMVYWSPFMYSNYKKEQEFIKKMHNYVLIVCVIIIIGIFILQDVLYFFVKGKYIFSQPYFMLLMISPVQSFICETTCYGIYFSNNTKYNLYICIFACIFNIIIGRIFYTTLGIWAIIIGIVGASIIQLLLKTYIGQKYYVSIYKKNKTIFTLLIIFSICTMNVFVYKFFLLRIFVSLIFLFCIIIIYYDTFLDSFHYIKNFIKLNRI